MGLTSPHPFHLASQITMSLSVELVAMVRDYVELLIKQSTRTDAGSADEQVIDAIIVDITGIAH